MTPRIIHSEQDVEMINQLETARMSWCLADVVNMNGVANLSSGNGLWGPTCSQVIYPDVTPCIDYVNGVQVTETFEDGVIQITPTEPSAIGVQPDVPTVPAVDPALMPQAHMQGYPQSTGNRAAVQPAGYLNRQ
jgi:hypothetical protein